MKKTKSIVIFVITLVVILATVYVAAFGIGGRGKASNITLGLDLRGGASVTYQVTDKNFTPEQMADYTTIGGTPFLDNQYTVFGEVVEGLDVVEKIQGVATGSADRPKEDVVMTVTVLE